LPWYIFLYCSRFTQKHKNPLSEISMILASHRKPSFVYAIIYLSSLLPRRSSGTPRIAQRATWDTALHTSKDFAVSPQPSDWIIPEGTLVFRHWRHCSHLYYY